MRTRRPLSQDEALAHARLRRLARRLPGSAESVSFGHPTFKVGGRAFAVLDHYDGSPCLWLRVDPMDRERLLTLAGWFASPYDPRRTALCVRLEAIDWRRIGRLVRTSHTLARMRPMRRR